MVNQTIFERQQQITESLATVPRSYYLTWPGINVRISIEQYGHELPVRLEDSVTTSIEQIRARLRSSASIHTQFATRRGIVAFYMIVTPSGVSLGPQIPDFVLRKIALLTEDYGPTEIKVAEIAVRLDESPDQWDVYGVFTLEYDFVV